jgi:hypothetical protein
MLSNVEKEKLVIDLYYNQRKNVRQIAQEARISFRDIAAILKKIEAAAVNGDGSGNGNGNGIRVVAIDNQQQQLGNGSSQSNQKSTHAYKLFGEGKTPVEVAIQLNLSEKEATRYYTEYWKLKRLYVSCSSDAQVPVNYPMTGKISGRSFIQWLGFSYISLIMLD